MIDACSSAKKGVAKQSSHEELLVIAISTTSAYHEKIKHNLLVTGKKNETNNT